MRFGSLFGVVLAAACAAPVQGVGSHKANDIEPHGSGDADAAVLTDAPPTADVVAGPDAVAPLEVAGRKPSRWQTSPCRAAIAAPRWWHDAIGYEVFVRSFADGDGDGIGDLKGLTAHLDYLNDGKPGQGNDLEVDLLWLMPLQPSPSYHGYDVSDYRGVNPQYGTEADLAALLQAAHARGMKVVLDLVLNHSSAQHPWFVGSAAGKDHAAWYVWQDADPGWTAPWGSGKAWHKNGKRWYYSPFSSGMPDLNYAWPAVRQEMVDVGAFWLARGVDGFRLDAVRYLVETGAGAGQQDTPGTLAFWGQFAGAMALAGQEPLLVGEAWASNATAAKYHADGTQPGLGMTFDFDLASALLGAVQTGDTANLSQVVCAQDDLFPAGVARGTFLTNHDMVRVATQLQQANGSSGDVRLAATLLFTLPGTPWLYYGEEIGMRNGTGGDDKAKRQPMQWTSAPGGGFTTGTPWQALSEDATVVNVAAQTSQPASLLAHYRSLTRARKAHPALRTGALEWLVSPAGTWAFLRSRGADRVLCAFNLGQSPATLDVPGATDTLSGAAVPAGPLTLPPRSSRVLVLTP